MIRVTAAVAVLAALAGAPLAPEGGSWQIEDQKSVKGRHVQ